MDNKNKTVNRGIGTSTLLGIIFIILKISGVIDWEWLWVLSPFWIPISIFVVVLLVIFIIGGIIAILDKS